MSTATPSKLGKAEQLRLQARQHKPTRMPWYVHHPNPVDGTTAPGWYWQPADAPTPAYLGHSFVAAIGALAVIPKPAKEPA